MGLVKQLQSLYRDLTTTRRDISKYSSLLEQADNNGWLEHSEMYAFRLGELQNKEDKLKKEVANINHEIILRSKKGDQND